MKNTIRTTKQRLLSMQKGQLAATTLGEFYLATTTHDRALGEHLNDLVAKNQAIFKEELAGAEIRINDLKKHGDDAWAELETVKAHLLDARTALDRVREAKIELGRKLEDADAQTKVMVDHAESLGRTVAARDREIRDLKDAVVKLVMQNL